MGVDLYYTIPSFFEKRMEEHSEVKSFNKLSVDGEFVYEITRVKHGDIIRAWLSDAYVFTETDFYNRPNQIRSGDYILVAKPEGTVGIDEAITRQAKIGVGKLGELMRALNWKKIWEYIPPSERKRRSKG